MGHRASNPLCTGTWRSSVLWHARSNCAVCKPKIFGVDLEYESPEIGVAQLHCLGAPAACSCATRFAMLLAGFCKSGLQSQASRWLQQCAVRCMSSGLASKDIPGRRPDREKMEYDVLIVGAGPAGLSAAIKIKQVRCKRSRNQLACVCCYSASIDPAWLGPCSHDGYDMTCSSDTLCAI